MSTEISIALFVAWLAGMTWMVHKALLSARQKASPVLVRIRRSRSRR